MTKMRAYVLPIIGLVVSIFLKIVTSFSFFYELIGNPKNIENVKKTIDMIDFLVLVLPLGFQSVLRAKSAIRCEEFISYLGQNTRDLAEYALKEKGYIEGTSDDINIRVFRKRFSRLVLEDRKNFFSRGIRGKLSFSIKKKEGLCAQAFSSRHSMLEVEDGSKDVYNLNDRQMALVGQLKFIVAIPIVCDSKNTIRRVICFDSFQQIAKNGCEEGILKICENLAYNLNATLD